MTIKEVEFDDRQLRKSLADDRLMLPRLRIEHLAQAEPDVLVNKAGATGVSATVPRQTANRPTCSGRKRTRRGCDQEASAETFRIAVLEEGSVD